jgi:L-amino acid N-acyltransferase YncA
MRDWIEERWLDGRRLTIRPIQPDDVDRLRRLFFRLSPETVHQRFFQLVKTPSEQMLHHFAEVDHERRQAIVATRHNEIVAVARYDRTTDTPVAEVAILVEDAWQGRGLGKLLLHRLAVEAVNHGIAELTATVLGENRRALGLARRVAPSTHSHLDHGEWYLDMRLEIVPDSPDAIRSA